MAKRTDRFEVVSTQGNGLTKMAITILRDKETGVNYLFCEDGYAGGLTPLLDRDGKPVISTVTDFDE